MNIFTQFFTKAQSDPEKVRQDIRRDLIRREAQIGKKLFGPIPKGRDREFFRIDKHTWIWQESWTENGQKQTRNTKYMVRDRDVVKAINGSAYEQASLEEVKNLQAAIHAYVERAQKEIYTSV